jgi:hypothetical protein
MGTEQIAHDDLYAPVEGASQSADMRRGIPKAFFVLRPRQCPPGPSRQHLPVGTLGSMRCPAP